MELKEVEASGSNFRCSPSFLSTFAPWAPLLSLSLGPN